MKVLPCCRAAVSDPETETKNCVEDVYCLGRVTVQIAARPTTTNAVMTMVNHRLRTIRT